VPQQTTLPRAITITTTITEFVANLRQFYADLCASSPNDVKFYSVSRCNEGASARGAVVTCLMDEPHPPAFTITSLPLPYHPLRTTRHSHVLMLMKTLIVLAIVLQKRGIHIQKATVSHGNNGIRHSYTFQSVKL
jgi:hypothetical protein